jgi:hypothetical protein
VVLSLRPLLGSVDGACLRDPRAREKWYSSVHQEHIRRIDEFDGRTKKRLDIEYTVESD